MGISRRQFSLGTLIAPLAAGESWRHRRDSVEGLMRHAAALAEKNPEARVIRLMIPEGSLANVEPLCLGFREATGVTVIVEEVPVDDVATIITVRTLSGDSRFDVALPPTFDVPSLAETGAILPLDGQPSMKWAAGDRKLLFPHGDRYKGKTYGFQTDGDVFLMYFNRRFFEDGALRNQFADRHGKELTLPTTWAELDEQLAFFHDPDEGRFGGTLFRTPDYIGWEYWARLHAKGTFPMDEMMRPLLNEPAAVEAAEELIAASKYLTTGSSSNGIFDNWKDFSRGRAYCNIGWGGSMKYFRRTKSTIREHVIPHQLPGGIDKNGQPFQTSYFNWGWNYTVSSQASFPDMGTAFAIYATSEAPSTTAVQAATGFFDPFLEAHYKDAKIEEIYSKPFLVEHKKAMEGAFPDLYLNGRTQYFDLLGRFLDRANRGRMSPDHALSVVSKGWEQITDSLGRQSQIDQWKFVRAAYPARLRAALAGQ